MAALVMAGRFRSLPVVVQAALWGGIFPLLGWAGAGLRPEVAPLAGLALVFGGGLSGLLCGLSTRFPRCSVTLLGGTLAGSLAGAIGLAGAALLGPSPDHALAASALRPATAGLFGAGLGWLLRQRAAV